VEAFLVASAVESTEARIVLEAYFVLAIAACLLAVLIATAISTVFIIARIYVGSEAQHREAAGTALLIRRKKMHNTAMICH
jgi:hypothetical protein